MSDKLTARQVAQNMAINDGLDWIARDATRRIAKIYKDFGWTNPPVISIGIAEAVLIAYKERTKIVKSEKEKQ